MNNKIVLVNLRDKTVSECESMENVYAICRDRNLNGKTAVCFEYAEGKKPYIKELEACAKADLYVECAARLQNAFGVTTITRLDGWKEIAHAVCEDVCSSSSFETNLSWNDDDISLAMVRVFNDRMNSDKKKSGAERLLALHKDSTLDAVPLVAEHVFEMIDMEVLTGYGNYDLFGIYHTISWIACDCQASWEKLTEEQQDEESWLDFMDELSVKKISYYLSEEIAYCNKKKGEQNNGKQ